MGVEIAHESYRVALANAGVKKAKLPPRLKIPRPNGPKASARRSARRAATVDEVTSMLAMMHKRG